MLRPSYASCTSRPSRSSRSRKCAFTSSWSPNCACKIVRCVRLHRATSGCIKLRQAALSYVRLRWATSGCVELRPPLRDVMRCRLQTITNKPATTHAFSQNEFPQCSFLQMLYADALCIQSHPILKYLGTYVVCKYLMRHANQQGSSCLHLESNFESRWHAYVRQVIPIYPQWV